MKRALAMGLGALMVAGSAAPASAAAHIDFSGYYRIMYNVHTNTSMGTEKQSFTDSYFQDRLQLDLTFSPTDEISVHWRLRGPGSYKRWGNSDPGNLTTKHIYAEVKQDWGTFLVGRMADDLDVAGLATFGYAPSTIPVFTSAMPFDRGDVMDGIRYSYDWDNGFSILGQYVKLGNSGQEGGRIGSNQTDSDEDYDRFQVQGAYAWDGGGVSLHVFYDRNAQSYGDWGDYTFGTRWATGTDWDDPNAAYRGWAPGNVAALAGDNVRALRLNKIEQWGLNPSIMHTWGDFSVHFEGMAMWGQAEYTWTENGRNRSGDIDGEGFGAYLDFDYNYGPGNVTLAGWWVSGTDLDEMYKNNPKSKSIADIVGGNFYPLLVAYNGVNSVPGGGDRYYGNKGGEVSSIAFANNAYENYVYGQHLGAIAYTGGAAGNYAAINDPTINLNANRTVDGDGVWDENGALYNGVLDANTNGNRTRTLSFNNGTDANHWAIALTGNHAFTDDISMHYGLAYLALNKANYRIVNSATYDGTNYGNLGYTTQDKDLGFEIDLGFSFQLLDNLKFTTAFGYMFNGDAYKQFKGYKHIDANVGGGLNTGDRIQGVWEDADDSYVWFNSLQFDF